MDSQLDHPGDVLRYLRSHRQGVLLCDDDVSSARFILDDLTGRIVLPVASTVLDAQTLVLMVPEESDDALQLLLSPQESDPRHDAACDRWEAYHGRPDKVRWVSCGIEAAKMGAKACDPGAIVRPNPLASVQARLCKLGNAAPDQLGAACECFAGVAVEHPVLVGVDPGGLDVRARFGIVRVPFESDAVSSDDAERLLRSMLTRGNR